ncbi:hypothetical protein EMIHUDRAFT_470289 [Emiliania huxleyi CCMP1516]|uniref:Anoctamin transmembrane domain-containing protein n=2 Tax=Emiliania huxleyi TaxID=2903 RepID=A0A0D3J1D6_EMIH1|nr:hypothetical protein EMIHUDRAFT_470289 [Emiliania huxleyi CCMP1516]EOD17321.1 hypothetical protein EMIHUDRAFT_470289 [Emiliania huxleyi CCMP1516]|eukprot:XP_005769750.1 hypothetical protein EMIHUDRAFT_470289 [Emiliania huxleyi CCMP1516]
MSSNESRLQNNHMDAASTNTDVLLALTAPEPVVRYVEQRVRAAGLRVARVPATATVLKVSAPSATLEREAEHLELEKRLRPEARSCASERHWPMREFVLAQRADFAGAGEGGFFTPSERVFLVTALLEAVPVDNASFSAALAAGAVREVPPRHLSSLLRALASVGLLGEVSAAHCAGRLEGWRRSVGLLREWAWLRSSEPLALDAIRDYWGERTGFLFAWQAFYVQALAPPAALGLCIWWRRPKGTSVDDDSAVPVFSLFSVVWALLFSVRRPEFVGREVVSEITGEVELVEGRGSRALRYAASLCVSLACLIVPLAYMFVSLNLQDSLRHDETARDCLRLPEIVIFLLNKAARRDCPRLPEIALLLLHQAYRHEAHDNSLIVKRFLFEAFDCYIALFYIAFELRDVDRLRVELVSLFSTDVFRRVFTEAVLPLLMQRLSRRRHAAASAAAKKEDGGAGGGGTDGGSGDLELDEHEDFDDYLEMVIQFGYITLFASAFPLASALALACNGVELYSDLFKVSYLCRRPRRPRVSGIGTWLGLLYVLVVASIFTNAVLIAFASDQLAPLLPQLFDARQRQVGQWPSGIVLLLVAVEHGLLLLLLATEVTLPRPPRWVRLTLARREHEALLAKRRLLLEAPVVATPLGDVIEATPVGGGGGSKR